MPANGTTLDRGLRSWGLISTGCAPVQNDIIFSPAMVILQKPNHFLRWYGLVVGLVAFAGTLWVMQTVFGSAGAGVVLGGVLFFAVWAVLEVILVPFAVLLGVDTDRGMIQVGSEEFPFAYILSVQPCARPFGVDGGGQDPGDRLFVHSSYTRQWNLTGAPALAAPAVFPPTGSHSRFSSWAGRSRKQLC